MKKQKILILILILIIVGCVAYFLIHDILYLCRKNKLKDDEVIEYVAQYMQQEYNKKFRVEILKKEQLYHNVPFSFMGIPTGVNSYKVRGAYSYELIAFAEDNTITTIQYNDAYRFKKKYYEAKIDHDYDNAIAEIERHNVLKKVAYQYLTANEIIECAYINRKYNTEKETITYGKSVIYLNYYEENLTEEFIAKLIAIYFDTSKKYDTNIAFLNDTSKLYLLTDATDFNPNNLSSLLKMVQVKQNENKELDANKKKIYNELCKELQKKIPMSTKNAKDIADLFFNESKYYMYGDFYEIEVSDYHSKKGAGVSVSTKTLNGNLISITAHISAEDSGKYMIENISLRDYYKSPINRFYLSLYWYEAQK